MPDFGRFDFGKTGQKEEAFLTFSSTGSVEHELYRPDHGRYKNGRSNNYFPRNNFKAGDYSGSNGLGAYSARPLTRIFENWIGQDMAMDLGTANTLIYIRGRGIVLNEPSVVAIREDDGRPIAVGRVAKEMYGKTARQIRCVRPLKDGVIADFETTHLMVKDFITRASKRWQLRRPRLIVSIPSGVTAVEKRAVIDAAMSAGARQIHLIEEPMAASIGSGMPVLECGGNMIVDIGGGTTEVAVISMGGTAYSESVRIAGDEMDEAIEKFVRRAFNLQIGIFEAERIKLNIGSAMPMSESREMLVYGRDLATGVPRELLVDDSTVRRALKEPVSAIIDAVRRALERTGPELAHDIIKKGIYLAGGGSLLAGLPERLSLETNIRFLRAADPLTAIVRGTGAVLENYKELKCVLIS
ncbi:MAG TPA: rod shape-determining protein [Oligoflexia bacterium]|nr:rod shape-determining protein [Oligoflexia bacterium]HMP49772.1 rod shape-determining protein [Oligoflexia bacterium]